MMSGYTSTSVVKTPWLMRPSFGICIDVCPHDICQLPNFCIIPMDLFEVISYDKHYERLCHQLAQDKIIVFHTDPDDVRLCSDFGSEDALIDETSVGRLHWCLSTRHLPFTKLLHNSNGSLRWFNMTNTMNVCVIIWFKTRLLFSVQIQMTSSFTVTSEVKTPCRGRWDLHLGAHVCYLPYSTLA